MSAKPRLARKSLAEVSASLVLREMKIEGLRVQLLGIDWNLYRDFAIEVAMVFDIDINVRIDVAGTARLDLERVVAKVAELEI